MSNIIVIASLSSPSLPSSDPDSGLAFYITVFGSLRLPSSTSSKLSALLIGEFVLALRRVLIVSGEVQSSDVWYGNNNDKKSRHTICVRLNTKHDTICRRLREEHLWCRPTGSMAA